LWKHGTTLAAYLLEQLQYVGDLQTTDQGDADTWDHVECIWTMAGSADPRERYVTTFDIVNITGGNIDNTWTQADFDTVEAEIAGICSSWTANMWTGNTFTQTRHYLRRFNPEGDIHPFAISGPPAAVYSHNVLGGASGPMPRQVAVTSTELTPYARHWGRNYWPCPAAPLVGSTGSLGSLYQTTLAQLVHDRYAALQDKDYFPVVPVTQVQPGGKKTPIYPYRGLLGVTGVQVDDVFDVVRRRRQAVAGSRIVLPT